MENNSSPETILNFSGEGRIIIFSAPSGSGKTTIVRKLLENDSRFAFSISAATRPPRPGEIHGVDYYFLSPQEFQERIQSNQFVEWEEVYPGKYYGTLQSEIDRIWAEGKHVLFDVDVQGGLNLKNYFQDHALGIFVAPPSLEVLEQRLRNRDADSESSIRERVMKASQELGFQDQFDHVIINSELDKTMESIHKLIADFLTPVS